LKRKGFDIDLFASKQKQAVRRQEPKVDQRTQFGLNTFQMSEDAAVVVDTSMIGAKGAGIVVQGT
jgi:hypothetical protein